MYYFTFKHVPAIGYCIQDMRETSTDIPVLPNTIVVRYYDARTRSGYGIANCPNVRAAKDTIATELTRLKRGILVSG